jgi:hypothetical protein
MIAVINIILGFLFWNWIFFIIDKDKADKKNEKFNYRCYLQKHWDNIGLTVIGAFILYFNAEEWWFAIMTYYKKEIEFMNIAYLGAGPFSSFLSWLFLTSIKFLASVKIGIKK